MRPPKRAKSGPGGWIRYHHSRFRAALSYADPWILAAGKGVEPSWSGFKGPPAPGATRYNGSDPGCRTQPERAQNVPCLAEADRQMEPGPGFEPGSAIYRTAALGRCAIRAMGRGMGVEPIWTRSQRAAHAGWLTPPSNWSSEPRDIPVRPLTPPGIAGGLLSGAEGTVDAIRFHPVSWVLSILEVRHGIEPCAPGLQPSGLPSALTDQSGRGVGFRSHANRVWSPVGRATAHP